MDKGKDGVEEALADLARRAWLGRYAFNEHCDNSLERFNRFKAAAAAIKSAVEGPLPEEVESLRAENSRLSTLVNHHQNWTADIAAELGCGDAARYRADALCCIRGLKRKAEKAEADLKAAQEREARLRGWLDDAGISECEECDGRGVVGGWEGGVEGGFVTYCCDVCGGTGKHALARPAGEPVEEVEG